MHARIAEVLAALAKADKETVNKLGEEKAHVDVPPLSWSLRYLSWGRVPQMSTFTSRWCMRFYATSSLRWVRQITSCPTGHSYVTNGN